MTTKICAWKLGSIFASSYHLLHVFAFAKMEKQQTYLSTTKMFAVGIFVKLDVDLPRVMIQLNFSRGSYSRKFLQENACFCEKFSLEVELGNEEAESVQFPQHAWYQNDGLVVCVRRRSCYVTFVRMHIIRRPQGLNSQIFVFSWENTILRSL